MLLRMLGGELGEFIRMTEGGETGLYYHQGVFLRHGAIGVEAAFDGIDSRNGPLQFIGFHRVGGFPRIGGDVDIGGIALRNHRV